MELVLAGFSKNSYILAIHSLFWNVRQCWLV